MSQCSPKQIIAFFALVVAIITMVAWIFVAILNVDDLHMKSRGIIFVVFPAITVLSFIVAYRWVGHRDADARSQRHAGNYGAIDEPYMEVNPSTSANYDARENAGNSDVIDGAYMKLYRAPSANVNARENAGSYDAIDGQNMEMQRTPSTN
jgi:hypothetical protein